MIRNPVLRLLPNDTGVDLHLADNKHVRADIAVLAAGVWSKPLAAAIGDAVPLDTERGCYNVTFPSGRLGLSTPVVFENEGFVATPLDIGDRVGGAVEFAGLNAPPDYGRVDAILARLGRFLRDLDTSGGERWMGFRPSLPDSLPVIGRSPHTGRVIHAFGHGHYGLTQAAITAELVAGLVAGRAPPISLAPFHPGRFQRGWRGAASPATGTI